MPSLDLKGVDIKGLVGRAIEKLLIEGAGGLLHGL